jgi:hypothetical protein
VASRCPPGNPPSPPTDAAFVTRSTHLANTPWCPASRSVKPAFYSRTRTESCAALKQMGVRSLAATVQPTAGSIFLTMRVIPMDGLSKTASMGCATGDNVVHGSKVRRHPRKSASPVRA